MLSKRFFLLGLIAILGTGRLGYSQRAENNVWKQFIENEPKESIRTGESKIYIILLPDSVLTSDLLPTGLNILRRLDKNTIIGSVSAKDYVLLRKHNVLLYRANHLWKLSDNLLNIREGAEETVVLKTSDKEKLTKFIQEETNFKILFVNNRFITLRGNISEIVNNFIERQDIEYIGNESVIPELESRISDLNLSVNQINKIHNEFPGANGLETTISIKDIKIDCIDIDLLGKCIASGIESERIGVHATDIATIISGSGNSSDKGRGVAIACKISSSDFQNILPDSYQLFQDLDINTQNHSYGTSIENFYGAFAEAYDQFSYENTDILHVFSSGNSGDSIPRAGNYAGIGAYANLTGNFKMAKNILTVGAVDQSYNLMSFSSRGPAYDGRIKPELVAYSTSGTSNAAALVSGISLLLQQEYKISHSRSAPSSLLKAVLINSAKDIGLPGPDFSTGYGNVNAYNGLKTIKDNFYFLDSIANSETIQYSIVIPDSVYELKVTLVWTDPAAPANFNMALVNDLDIRLIDTHASVWEPWVLDHSPSLTSLETPAQRGADRLNNIEQVTLKNIPPGEYKFEVYGFKVESGKQGFSIAYQWDPKDNFEWIFPIKNSKIEYDGFSESHFQWLSTYQATLGELSISYDFGASWQNVEDNIDLDKQNYGWVPDSNDKNLAMLKMKIGMQEYLSDTFVISPITRLNLGLKCEETMELRWNEIQNAGFYKIFNLQNNSMQKIDETSNNTYVFSNGQFTNTQFAVQPIYSNEKFGIRSEAIDTENFDTSCYINSFYAFASEEEDIMEVFLHLESLYQVDYVEIYRINKNKSSLIETVNRPDSLEHIIVDASPGQGINYYMAIVSLLNQKQFTSDLIFSYFLTDDPFLVFPNPTSKDGVNIYTGNFDSDQITFKLYTLEGKLIFTKNIESDRNFVELSQIQSGMYIYKLESNSGLLKTDKLLVY